MTRRIGGLSEIARAYDAVLVDQYGVLHDGQAPFPGALAALEGLRALGLPVVALTNSGKRAAPNAARLERLGFPAPLFAAVISSGEVVRQDLRDALDAGSLAPGSRVILLSRDGDRSVIDGLALALAQAGEPADLVLIAGTDPDRHGRDDYRAMLAPYARAGVPAICANPDRVMYSARGAAEGPGIVASDYAAGGGPMRITGKPAAPIFEAGLAAAGSPDPARTLMIGDSPHHDIAGAAALGIATLLVEGGVQARHAGDTDVAADHAIGRLLWTASG